MIFVVLFLFLATPIGGDHAQDQVVEQASPARGRYQAANVTEEHRSRAVRRAVDSTDGRLLMARSSKHSANRRALRGGIASKRRHRRAGRIHHAVEHTAKATLPGLMQHPYHTDRPSMPGARPLTYPE